MRYIGEDDLPQLVSAANYKGASHIGEFDVVDDDPLNAYLAAAQEVVCTATGISPVAGSYEFTWPLMGREWRRWYFPCRPVEEITEIAANDETGAFVVQDMTGVQLVQGYDEPQLLLPDGWAGFGDDVHTLRIRATVGGYVPRQVTQAIQLLAREWYNAGILIEGEGPKPRMTFGPTRLIKQVRYQRPRVAEPV